MNYSPIDLSANLNCRAVTLKHKRNYNLWLENMNFTNLSSTFLYQALSQINCRILSQVIISSAYTQHSHNLICYYSNQLYSSLWRLMSIAAIDTVCTVPLLPCVLCQTLIHSYLNNDVPKISKFRSSQTSHFQTLIIQNWLYK